MSNAESVRQKILDIINSNIENTNLQLNQADEDLVAMGIDSIKFISIVVALEETFEIEYPDDFLLITQSNTLNKLGNIIADALEKKITEGAAE